MGPQHPQIPYSRENRRLVAYTLCTGTTPPPQSGVKMKRLSKYFLIGIGALFGLAALALWILSSGSLPLEDGVELAGGNVIVVADHSTGPVATAAYLFRLNGGGLGLIDATADSKATAIRAALRRLGATTKEVRVILFTHGHGDHTAGARAFPDADVYVLEPDPSTPTYSPWNRFERMLRKPGKARQAAPQVTRRLTDGLRLDLHGTSVEVFALPGHTADSAAFLLHGVLFLGDSAAAHSKGGIASAPPIFSADRNRNQVALASLANRLRERRSEVKHLAFGHQGPLEGLEPLLQWAADHK